MRRPESWSGSYIVLALFAVVALLPNATFAKTLSEQASAYLASHAEDPIHWKPWRQEVFEHAKTSNKLIFLSIGYSSCHWCHKFSRDTLFRQPHHKITQ